ncbi:hypothetical protein MFLAVUS_010423 [Mucor flavus]|uniref:Phosphodiesterase n=1 Tax=Mucor flavus TaxID=439312 RepID=A0ABP9ZCN3_9FUNG
MDSQTCTIILLNQSNPFYIHDNDQDTTSTLLETVFGHDETIPQDDQLDLISQTVHVMPQNIPVIVTSTSQDANFMLECIQAGAANYLLSPLRPDVIKTLFLTLHRQQSKLTESTLYQDHLVSSSTISTVTSVISPTTPTVMPSQTDRIKALNIKDLHCFTETILNNSIPLPSTSIKPLTSEHKWILQDKISVWDFSPLNLSNDDLIHCGVLIISQVFSLTQVTSFSQEQLYQFITDLSSIYHEENPYHNFAHAIDVLQCIYFFLCQMGLLPFANGTTVITNQKSYRILRPKDILALLIAAIGHDVAHPGVNNSFLINTSAPLALLYNDNSVLESFHAMTLFQLLKKHKFDQALGDDYNEFRKLVITSILATDMALHSDYVIKINEQKLRLEESDPYDWDETKCLEERLLFCSGLMKCADISNVARPFARAFEWANILIEEFASQGDLERELGLHILPMNDRSKIVLEDSQIGFMKFVALGLFTIIGDYTEELSFPVEHIKMNLSIWEHRKRANSIAQSTTTTVTDKKLPRNENEEYHAQATYALGKRDDDCSFKLPKMPAVAMTSLSQNNNNNIYPHKDSNQREYDHTDWDPQESSGPVYCQCIIQ